MQARHPKRVHPIPGGSGQHISKHNNLLPNVKKLTIFLLDLRKVEPLAAKAYAFLEQMKDGNLTIKNNNKDSCWLEVGKNIHLVVFSNHLPLKQTLSQDRYVIYNLKQENLTHQRRSALKVRYLNNISPKRLLNEHKYLLHD